MPSSPGPPTPRAVAQRERSRGVALVFAGIGSVQFGAATAATLFPLIGPPATVGLRFTLAAVLLAVPRGLRVRGRSAAELLLVAALGVALAVMVLSLYEAMERMPLGVVVTVEFLGPLSVAVVLSRRWRDLAIAVVAAAGVVVLTGGLRGAELVGVLFALGAAAGWALYIVVNASIARRRVEGGLPLAAVVAALLVAPWALPSASGELLDARILLIGLLVAVTSSVVPHTADMRALRVVPTRVFGVLMSLHPAVAAVAGFVVLDQRLTGGQLVGIALVVAASAVAAWLAQRPDTTPEELAADGLAA